MNRMLTVLVIVLVALMSLPIIAPTAKAQTSYYWFPFQNIPTSYCSSWPNGQPYCELYPLSGGVFETQLRCKADPYTTWQTTALVRTGFYRYTGPTTVSGDATATNAFTTNNLKMGLSGSGSNIYRDRVFINVYDSNGYYVGQTYYTSISVVNSNGQWSSLSGAGGPVTPLYGNFYYYWIYDFVTTTYCFSQSGGISCYPPPWDFICWPDSGSVEAMDTRAGDGVSVRMTW